MLQSSRESNYKPHVGIDQHGTVFYRDSIAEYRPIPELSEECSIECDVMSLIENALLAAKERQPELSADPDDYYLFNFTVGWEGMGHWEADGEISNLSLTATPIEKDDETLSY